MKGALIYSLSLRSLCYCMVSRLLIKPSNTRYMMESPRKRLKASLPEELSKGMNQPVISLQSRKDSSSSDLLWEFATHSEASFHDITPYLANKIKYKLLSWYYLHRRKLPWRGDSLAVFNSSEQIMIPVTGYSVWVSEVMLQQTRVETVVPYYVEWMKSFPDIQSLASASAEEVNSHWAGLGYYRRAKFLHQGAKHIMEKYQGVLPKTTTELITIPGIGKYTASAIASIAFGENVPVVDGNVCRVFSRLTAIANHIKAPILKDSHAGCWKLANSLFLTTDDYVLGQTSSANPGYNRKGHAISGDLNQALMELGATLCAPIGSTGIDEDDPLVEFYLSTRIGQEIIRQMISQEKWDVNEFISKAKQTRDSGNSRCKLCDPNGIDQIIFDISKKIEDQGILNRTCFKTSKYEEEVIQQARIIGHSAFPLVNPKKMKKEEILAVAVLSYNKKLLMVKRPENGLLAGQWEFPTVSLWCNSSSNNVISSSPERKKSTTKRGQNKIDTSSEESFISKATRTISLDSLLKSISAKGEDELFDSNWLLEPRVSVNDEPMEHIFSHVRHRMWIEYGVLSDNNKLHLSIDNRLSLDGRDVKWLSQKDMEKVGITSGVKKILAIVRKAHINAL